MAVAVIILDDGLGRGCGEMHRAVGIVDRLLGGRCYRIGNGGLAGDSLEVHSGPLHSPPGRLAVPGDRQFDTKNKKKQ